MDSAELLKKPRTWDPPKSLDAFLLHLQAELGFRQVRDTAFHAEAVEHANLDSETGLLSLVGETGCMLYSMDTRYNYVDLVRATIATSEYKDAYTKPYMDLELRAYLEVKRDCLLKHPNAEECIDVGAYAYMLWHQRYWK